MKILHLAYSALTMAAVLWAYQSAAQQADIGSQDEGFMPEFYFYDPNEPNCTLRLELRGDSLNERRDLLLSIIDFAYADTESWAQDFNMSGIDYFDFRYAHFIVYQSCERSQEIMWPLNEKFRLSRNDWTESEHTNLVSTTDELDEFGQLGMFIRYNSKARVRQCLVRISLVDIESSINAANSFWFIQIKYRPPIADIDLQNRDIYILVSRRCEEKRAIYEQLTFLLEREGRPTDIFSAVDFDPPPYSYFYKYQHQLNLPDEGDPYKVQ